MSIVYTATTSQYNEVFTENYDKLLTFAKGNDDRVHDAYIKVNKKVETNTFTGHSITQINQKLVVYSKTAMFNDFKTEYTSRKPTVEVTREAEYILQDEDKHQEDAIRNDEMYQFMSIKLFDYLKKNYDETNGYVFRCYYLYDSSGKKITYKQLSEVTGFSISKCCGIIQTIKADLKENLIKYIEDGN